MKQTLQISAQIDEPIFMQNYVEQLAYRRYEIGYCNENVPRGFTAIETYSIATYVSGTLGIDFPNGEEHINMPFTTAFLFTCIKGKSDPYHLIWSSSLS